MSLENSQELINWWSHDVCPACHYDLKRDPDELLKEKWYAETGCPSCNKSFVD